MRLCRRLEVQGELLFRHRSYLPLLLLPVALGAFVEAARLEPGLGESLDHAWMLLCLAVSLSGLALRWATVGFVPPGTSGRNTAGQRAVELNTTGLYSVVRNPLYLGNFLAILGVVMTTLTWWFVLLAGLAYWLYIERIIAAEEAYLSARFGKDYERWAAGTSAFVPRWRAWRRPARPFSLRTVLRREYNGVMAVATAFLASDMILDLGFERQDPLVWLREDRLWIAIFAAAAALFLTLRTLKKHTRLLSLAGR